MWLDYLADFFGRPGPRRVLTVCLFVQATSDRCFLRRAAVTFALHLLNPNLRSIIFSGSFNNRSRSAHIRFQVISIREIDICRSFAILIAPQIRLRRERMGSICSAKGIETRAMLHIKITMVRIVGRYMIIRRRGHQRLHDPMVRRVRSDPLGGWLTKSIGRSTIHRSSTD